MDVIGDTRSERVALNADIDFALRRTWQAQ
jgi:hypothetical protein